MDRPRLSRLEAELVGEHHFVRPQDEIYFLFEYTARMGFRFSPGNRLVGDLKIDRQKFADRPDLMARKAEAIGRAARMIGAALDPGWAGQACFIPVPPSRGEHDPGHDDRMWRLARAIRIAGQPVDARRLVRQTTSLPAAHQAEARPRIETLVGAYALDAASCEPAPQAIAILDDVLTTGRHFRAMARVLGARFPNARIVGLFVTRRAWRETSI